MQRVPLGDDRVGELLVVLRARAGGGVLEDGLAEGRALGEFDVAADRRLVDACAPPRLVCFGGLLEESRDVGDDLAGVLGCFFVGAEDDARDAESFVDSRGDHGDGLEEFAEALEGEEVCLHGDDDFAGGGECVEGEQAEGGRAIDEDEFVALLDGIERGAEPFVSRWRIGEFGLAGRKVGDGGEEVEGGSCVVCGVVCGLWSQEEGIGGVLERVGVDAEVERGVCLWIEVDEEGGSISPGECGGKVDGGGRLSDSSLLVHECDNTSDGVWRIGGMLLWLSATARHLKESSVGGYLGGIGGWSGSAGSLRAWSERESELIERAVTASR